MNATESYSIDYPSCLQNNGDLQLAPVSLRYLDVENTPSLLTIYELEKSPVLAFNEISKIICEIENESLSDFGIKGMFSLALSYFETMLNELMIKQLQFFPQKISYLKRTNGETRKESKEIYLSQSVINTGSIVEYIIEKEVQKLAYDNIETVLHCFLEIISIDGLFAKANIEELIEVKETRNLLVHNNLVVNETYLRKTKSVKRASKAKELITIEKEYALKSLRLILKITEEIILELRNKYGKFTLVSMLKKLWRFTFKSEGVKFDDFCTINYEKDVYDGPFAIPDWISSSETTFMEFWQSQRTSSVLNKPSLSHLDSRNVRKLAFLVEVFGQLRFPHWTRDISEFEKTNN